MSCNRTFNVLEMPQKIWLGRKGEMNFRPVSFEWGEWHNEHPSATLSVIYTSPNRDVAPLVVATGTNTPVIWQPTTDVSTVSGYGSIECHLVDGDEVIGISAAAVTIIDDSASGTTATEPSWVDQVVADVAAEADRAEAAADSIGTQIDEAVAEAVPSAVADYIEEHPITVDETDPTVPAWAKQPTKPTYTAQEVGALPSSYTPPVVSVNGKTGAVTLDASDVGAYVKPSGGIPKTDLAQAVQTSLGKADTALQQHQSLSGYATETWVGQQIANIPDELPVVSASDDGKVLGVVNGAWSVKSDEGGGGSATFEIPITQSGSTYSTTATAADILANKDDCAIALNGGAIRIPLDYYTVSSGITYLFFGTTSLADNSPHIVNMLVQVSGNTVSVSQAEYTIRSAPAVTASDNGKFLRVVNGAWAAQTVPAAESNSFGGGA